MHKTKLVSLLSLFVIACGEESNRTPDGGTRTTTYTTQDTRGTLDVTFAEAHFGFDTYVPDSNCHNTTLEAVVRDFKVGGDFEMAFQGDEPRRGLVQDTLDSDRKPVFKHSVGCAAKLTDPLACRTDWSPPQPVIASAESFRTWYRDTAGVNQSFTKLIELQPSTTSGMFVYETDKFFPLSVTEGFGATPSGAGNNYLFTTEIHVKFTYRPGQQFTFRGDDDLWVFINGTLALDLGSMHSPALGTIDFDAQATRLGISAGGTYSMDVFHAERHTWGSNFRIETNISCFVPVFGIPL